MNHSYVRYVVAGGGVAGSAAIEAIRRRDAVGSVLFVGQEVNRPYHRPPLSKAYLRKKVSRGELSTLPVGWYAERRVELRTGRRATAIDTVRSSITLDDGEVIAFDQLLLATGATPLPLKIPGGDLPNVFYLRSLADADRLLHGLDVARAAARPGRPVRVAVVGGGFIGLEVTATLRQLDAEVDLLLSHAHPWERIVGENGGRFLGRFLEARGVHVHPTSPAMRLEGDGRVQRIVCEGGAVVPCDLVVAAVGAAPPRDLVRGTPIRAEHAILVDEQCRTNIPNIFAAGDCAAIFDQRFGKHRNFDHWDQARITGNLAGTNMAGGDERYDVLSCFRSDVFDLQISGWGEAKLVYRHLLRGNAAGNEIGEGFAEIGIAADGRVAQVIAVGRAAEHALLARCVEERLAVDGNEEILKDPARPLDSLFV